MKITDVAGLGSISKEILRMLERIGGKVTNPWQTRRMADARSYETVQAAIAESIVMKLKSDSDSDAITQMAQSFLLKESRRVGNLQAVTILAVNHAESFEDSSGTDASADETVSEDWMTRWMNIVEDVTEEDMQALWARILVGEMRKPSSFSLRTLDILRNMSSEEARIFQKVAQFGIISFPLKLFVHHDFLVKLSKHELIGDDVHLLVDCGILHPIVPFTGLSCSGEDWFIHAGTAGLVKYNGTAHLSVVSFTTAGMELSRLIKLESQAEYFTEFLQGLKNEGHNVAIGKVTRWDADCMVETEGMKEL